MAAIAAIYPDARNPFAHPELLVEEGLEEWAVAETWLMAHPDNNHGVDITDVFDTKIAALRAHVRQTGAHGRLRGPDARLVRSNAVAAGLPEGRFVEGFFVVSTA